MTYAPDEVERVLRLAAKGQSGAEIGRLTGIPQRTISGWLSGRTPRPPESPDPTAVASSTPEQYAYLLGLYLGDGHIVHQRRGVYRLTLVLDAVYPGIIEAAAVAMRAVMPNNRTFVSRVREGAVRVHTQSKLWPFLFPQHGPGRKHEREIQLVDWQRAITRGHPRELVRGLIHSDGCRIVARQPGHGIVYLYPRYWFDNKSQDIIEIFCEHLALIGVEWTQPRPDGIQIARRASVQLLDSFIGPKW